MSYSVNLTSAAEEPGFTMANPEVPSCDGCMARGKSNVDCPCPGSGDRIKARTAVKHQDTKARRHKGALASLCSCAFVFNAVTRILCPGKRGASRGAMMSQKRVGRNSPP